MTPTDFERLRSWSIEIAETLLPGVKWRQEGVERRALGTKLGLSINTASGAWYSHAAGRGGWNPASLIALLQNHAEVDDWAAAWLRAHAGTGSITGTDDGDIAEIEAAELTKSIIAELVSATGTPAETYLRSRDIAGPIPDFVKYLPDARPGEGAIAAFLHAHGRLVGVQIGYIDPQGRKSLANPARRRFMLEKSPGAVFEIPADTGVVDLIAETVIAEGLEDALSLGEMGRRWKIVGLPGIAALRHVLVKQGERVVVCRDGDESGSAADTALAAGLDALILAGADVRVTDTPPGADVNALLLSGGVEALIELINTANIKPKLTRDGEIERLSRLDPLDYDAERRRSTDKITGHEGLKGVRLGTLQREIDKRRRARNSDPAADADNRPGKAFEFTDTELHPEPVDGDVLLERLTEVIGQYVIMSRNQRVCVALWAIFSHLFDIADVAPKLLIKSPLSECGKTRLMRVVRYLSPRPLIVSNATASAVFRIIEMYCPTLLLDEVDTFVVNNEELRGILDSGFDREHAAVLRSTSGSDRDIEPRIFSTWCPQVLAGIGTLQSTITRRCFVIELQRKRKDQTVARLTRRTAGPLLELASKVARWADDYRDAVADIVPQIPAGMSDRLDEGWEVPLAIAEVIGGEWPEQARRAALAISGQSEAEDDSIGTQLLTDIRAVFAAEAVDKFGSDALVTALVNLEDRPWAEIDRGNPLTKNRLARLLKPFHISPGTVQIGSGKQARTPKGYKLQQFADAFARYLPDAATPISENTTARPPGAAETQGFQADLATARDTAPGGLKTSENLSVFAAPGGLAVAESKNGGDAEIPEISAPRPNGRDTAAGGSAVGTGAANGPLGRPPRTAQEHDIVAHARANPGDSVAVIATAFGQPKSLIRELLERAQ